VRGRCKMNCRRGGGGGGRAAFISHEDSVQRGGGF